MSSYTLPMQNSTLCWQALIQAHRWFQFYEQTEHDINNQLSLLTEDIHVKSSFDESLGHQAYCDRVAKIPSHWKNAHHIQNIEIKQKSPHTLALTINIIYQNIGYLPSAQLMNTPLKYTTELLINDNKELPKFFEIQIEPCKLPIPDGFNQFIDSYQQNRIRSLVYQLITLFDSEFPDANGFKEIFMPEIELQLASNRCTSYEEFNHWFKERPAQMQQSKHILDSLNSSAVSSNTFHVSLEFTWHGFLKQQPDEKLSARTLHHWTVIDNPLEPFARIQTMNVKSLPCAITAIA